MLTSGCVCIVCFLQSGTYCACRSWRYGHLSGVRARRRSHSSNRGQDWRQARALRRCQGDCLHSGINCVYNTGILSGLEPRIITFAGFILQGTVSHLLLASDCFKLLQEETVLETLNEVNSARRTGTVSSRLPRCVPGSFFESHSASLPVQRHLCLVSFLPLLILLLSCLLLQLA